MIGCTYFHLRALKLVVFTLVISRLLLFLDLLVILRLPCQDVFKRFCNRPVLRLLALQKLLIFFEEAQSCTLSTSSVVNAATFATATEMIEVLLSDFVFLAQGS